MAGWTKLWSDIVLSTVWREEMHVKVVWITMLALADQHGHVRASIPGLADAARVSIPQCEEALTRFRMPDHYSRTQDFEGRRIIDLEDGGGWLLLTYEKHRAKVDDETRREQTRQAVARYRQRQKALRQVSGDVSTVSESKPSKPRKAQAEAEAEAESVPEAVSASSSAREELLNAAPNRRVWEAEIAAMEQKMPGHHAPTPEQLETAITEYVANNDFRQKPPSLRGFCGYVKRCMNGPVGHAAFVDADQAALKAWVAGGGT